MLFILVKSLDEVRWQCGVYGHHVFGRRSTQARSSVTAGRCTSCLPHPCGTRAASTRETLLATNGCAWHTTARCLRSPPCQMPQKPCAHRWPETLQQARRRPAEGGAGHVHTPIRPSGTCCAPCRMLRHAPRSDSANVRSRPLSLIMRSRTTRNAAAPRSPTRRTKTGAP